jgi:hypothetical protein
VLDCAVGLKTAIDYDRCFENFEKFCKAAGYESKPLSFLAISTFMVFIVLATKKATMIGPVWSALQHIQATRGLDPLSATELARLKRLRKGLKKLAPHIAKKALPFTLKCMVSITDELDRQDALMVKLADYLRTQYDQRTNARDAVRLAFLQWKARSFMAHSSMLRASDHSHRERKAHNQMTKGCVQWGTDLLTLWVPPGKANADFEPSFHCLRDHKACAAKHFLMYWLALDFDNKPENCYLWPNIVNGNVIWSSPSPVKAFVALTIFLLTLLPALFPAWYIKGITGHSWRCGGCTDLLAAGAPDSFVRVQGRWRSPCYHIYNRHSMAYGRLVSARLFDEMAPSWKTSGYEKFVSLTSHITDDDGI